MAKLTYSEQLRRPEWQKKRLEILQRDGFECKNCGSNEKMLHVHHVYYEKGKQAWDYPDECFQTLCADCHQEHTNVSKELSKILGGLDECLLSEVMGFARAVQYDASGNHDREIQITSPFEAMGWLSYFCERNWNNAVEIAMKGTTSR